MSARAVAVFFYGSYMGRDVLEEAGLEPAPMEVARVVGFDIRIEPRANLVRAYERCVYGVVTHATHADLRRLYAHAQDVLGEAYLPEAVLAESLHSTWVPALAYVAPEMEPRPADPAYVDRILGPARALGFPAWYVERIAAFRGRTC